jgi:hypothetical protein
MLPVDANSPADIVIMIFTSSLRWSWHLSEHSS